MSATKSATQTRAPRKSKVSAAPASSDSAVDGPGDGGSDAPAISTVVRRKDMIGRVAESSGLRPNQIKPVMDAVLRELGEALARGEALNLPPLGKLSINRTRETGNADIIVMKLRRSKAMVEADGADGDDQAGTGKGGDQGLADDDE